MPRSTRTMIAILLWLVAAFLAMNNIISGATLNDWVLPVLLTLAGLTLWFWPESMAAAAAEEMTAAEAEIAHSQDRTDALAASAGTGDPALQDPIENISTDPTATLADGGELAGPPTASIGHEEPDTAASQDRASTLTSTAEADTASRPVPAATLDDGDDLVEPPAASTRRAGEEIVDSQDRSDTLAASADTGDPTLQDPMENISTDPTATLADGGELAGPPTPSLGHEEVVSEAAEPDSVVDDEPAHEPDEGETDAVEIEEGVDERVDVGEEMAIDEQLEAVEELAATDAPETPPVDEQPAPQIPGQPDDLRRIDGIGPKMASALAAAGIDTFDKLSKASEDDIRAAILAAGMRFAPTVPTWPKQAAYAAAADWDGLKAYQASLAGGREIAED